MTHEEILAMLGDYVNYLIANSSAEAPMWNIEKVRSGKPNKWNYIDGCMITACLSLYNTTGGQKYLDFSKDFIDCFVQEDGSIKTYDPKEYNLDNVNQGKNLFILYDIFGDEKYRKAIDTSAASCSPSPAPRRATSGTKTSTRGRSGWTAPTWPSRSTWSMRPATTRCRAALTATSSS